MKKEYFGRSHKNEEVTLYTLENEHLIMKVMDYGAALVSFIDKTTGIDIVEGFDSMEGYLKQTSYIGASIGRTANRIGKGLFTLNGVQYSAPINNNGNCNHGGLEGFDKKMYAVEADETKVCFSRISADGEEGYPGNLEVKITYTLLENGISIKAEGTPDGDTLFAYTNHSYFNLYGNGRAMEQTLQVNTDVYAPLDETGMAIDRLDPVADTPFDFREAKPLCRDIEADNEQLRLGKGYDHYYPIPGSGMRTMAVLSSDRLQLSAVSDFPGIHIYSGNWLDEMSGKYDVYYGFRSACALETAYMPNAINYEDVEAKPIVRNGETSVHEVQYLLKVIG